MKKQVYLFVYIVLVAIISFSCKRDSTPPRKEVPTRVVSTGYEVVNPGIQVLEIEGCEYIWVKYGNGAGLTHKGNCKFCKEP